MKAILRNNRQSPRKVRLVANLIKGKKVTRALDEMRFTDKKACDSITKLLESALANALNSGFSKENLIVQEVRVDAGSVLKRSMPRARGSAFPIKKRSSHISITLAEKK